MASTKNLAPKRTAFGPESFWQICLNLTISIAVAPVASTAAVATATSATATTTAATATASAAITAASTASATTFALRTGLVNHESAAHEFSSVQCGYSFFGFRIVANFRKAETAWLARETIAKERQ